MTLGRRFDWPKSVTLGTSGTNGPEIERHFTYIDGFTHNWNRGIQTSASLFLFVNEDLIHWPIRKNRRWTMFELPVRPLTSYCSHRKHTKNYFSEKTRKIGCQYKPRAKTKNCVYEVLCICCGLYVTTHVCKASRTQRFHEKKNLFTFCDC